MRGCTNRAPRWSDDGMAASASPTIGRGDLRPREQLLRKKRSLQGADLDQTFLREGDEACELVAGKCGFLASALNFDKLAATGHHDIKINFGVLVLDVREIEQVAPAEHANADRGDGVREGVLHQLFRVEEFLHRKAGREIR